MTVLVTGGAGFIGSHTVVELLKENYDVIIVDDLSNAKEEVIDRIETITGVRPVFYKMDCCDRDGLCSAFAKNQIDAVIHFAGYKAVGESVKKPLEYYRNNLDSTLTLQEVCVLFLCNGVRPGKSLSLQGRNARYSVLQSLRLV